jgi:hypothetical protein
VRKLVLSGRDPTHAQTYKIFTGETALKYQGFSNHRSSRIQILHPLPIPQIKPASRAWWLVLLKCPGFAINNYARGKYFLWTQTHSGKGLSKSSTLDWLKASNQKFPNPCNPSHHLFLGYKVSPLTAIDVPSIWIWPLP